MFTEKMIEVIEAFEKGKSIEAKIKGEDNWFTSSNPVWNFAAYDYRVKEEKEVKKSFMTNEQLAELLVKGYGVVRFGKNGYVMSGHVYTESSKNRTIQESEHIMIRPWGSDEWVKPTVDVYEKYFGVV